MLAKVTHSGSNTATFRFFTDAFRFFGGNRFWCPAAAGASGKLSFLSRSFAIAQASYASAAASSTS